ncbi:MAG: hypothetical protein H0V30_12290 [Chitinophagaceae bacterium]|jgi:hypothetical protein|nr:hypothetical protein [Chitinophagaceae bacterium]
MSILLLGIVVYSQQRFSISTDASVLRSYQSSQKFWAFGQTVTANFHIYPSHAVYIFVSYYSPGKFVNQVKAVARQPATQPQQLDINNRVEINYKTISVGYKRYLKGNAYAEDNWNLYGYAGFGLIMANAQNNFQINIDTSLYEPPLRPTNNEGRFQRLTLDVALGGELPIKGDLFLYLEGRSWVLTSQYPTPLLLENKNAPMLFAFNFGLRILF